MSRRCLGASHLTLRDLHFPAGLIPVNVAAGSLTRRWRKKATQPRHVLWCLVISIYSSYYDIIQSKRNHKGDRYDDRSSRRARMRNSRIARQTRPTRPDLSAYTDYSQFTEPELIAELLWMHDQLQILWGCVLQLDPID